MRKPHSFLRVLAVFALCLTAGLMLVSCDSSNSGSGAAGNSANSGNSGSQAGKPDDASGSGAGGQSAQRVQITMEDGGVILLELDPSQAPLTVANFVKLADSGFYDGLTFHRVVPGFVIQGGDPQGDGTGGSDEKIKGEFTKNGVNNNISHVRGVISMARSAQLDSASCQFFITNADALTLDGSYAAFGHVVSGMEIVDAITALPTDANDKPLTPPVIKSIRSV